MANPVELAKAVMMPNPKITPPSVHAARARPQLWASIKYDATTSSSEMALVSAAKTSSPKNTIPSIMPSSPISANASGMLMKTSPGPLLGSCPYEKIIGNIIRQASNAIAVSKIAIDTDCPSKPPLPLR